MQIAVRVRQGGGRHAEGDVRMLGGDHGERVCATDPDDAIVHGEQIGRIVRHRAQPHLYQHAEECQLASYEAGMSSSPIALQPSVSSLATFRFALS